MLIYRQAYIHTCIHTYLHACLHAYLAAYLGSTYVQRQICTHTRICSGAYIHTCIHACLPTHLSTCPPCLHACLPCRMRASTARLHACMHACIHTYMHARSMHGKMCKERTERRRCAEEKTRTRCIDDLFPTTSISWVPAALQEEARPARSRILYDKKIVGLWCWGGREITTILMSFGIPLRNRDSCGVAIRASLMQLPSMT